MVETRLSIRKKTGKIDHNFRITKRKDAEGNYVPMRRQHIDPEMSQYNIVLEQADPDPFLCVERVYKDNMTDALNSYNEEQIKSKHPERVRTVQSYMEDIKASYIKDPKRNPPLVQERVIKIGNKNTMPSYTYDENGKKILSPEAKKSIKILTAYFEIFKKQNPNMKNCYFVIHCDESGSVHAHHGYVSFATRYKRGLQVRNSMSAALKEQYEKQGVRWQGKTGQYNNPLTRWTAEQRQIIKELCAEQRITIIEDKSEDRDYLTDREFRAVMRSVEAGETPNLDLPVEQIKRKFLGNREETAEEYKNRIIPIIKKELKKRSDAERFQKMRADAAEEKMKRMERERKTDHQRVEDQLAVLRNQNEQERYKKLQKQLQQEHDDEIGRLASQMQDRAEKELKKDKECLQNQINETANQLRYAKEKNREAEQYKRQAENEKSFAEKEAAMIKKKAERKAAEIVSAAEATASAIINKAFNDKEVVGLIQKNALSIIHKEHPDIYKSAESRAFKEFHSSLFKSRGENTLIRQ